MESGKSTSKGAGRAKDEQQHRVPARRIKSRRRVRKSTRKRTRRRRGGLREEELLVKLDSQLLFSKEIMEKLY